MRALVIGGSGGIGAAIARALNDSEKVTDLVVTSKEDLDTSSLKSVQNFVERQVTTDILVLNTGGPPAKNFYDITESEWLRYYYQLFYSFIYILQNLHVRDGGYIFLISSFQIKEPEEKMTLSVSYRIALASVLKTLSKSLAQRGVSCVNIAPGPIDTPRLRSLVDDFSIFEASLPMGRAGDSREIGSFLAAIVDADIKYLTGVSINFDGGLSNFVL